jgi:cytochrome b6-f complex iron-sulfur subunit
MERRDFLEKLGIGAAFVLTSTCLGACTKEDYTPTTPVDFTLDLTLPANAALNTNGGYIVDTTHKVVVARDTAGNYVAATQICSHEGQLKVTYEKASNGFKCSAHDATFSIAGAGTNSNGSRNLTIYKTTLTGTKLRVFS